MNNLNVKTPLMSDKQPLGLRKALVLAGLTMFLGACGSQTDWNETLSDRSSYLEDPSVNEVAATPFTHGVTLTPGQDGLDPQQHADMSAFLEQTGRDLLETIGSQLLKIAPGDLPRLLLANALIPSRKAL